MSEIFWGVSGGGSYFQEGLVLEGLIQLSEFYGNTARYGIHWSKGKWPIVVVVVVFFFFFFIKILKLN